MATIILVILGATQSQKNNPTPEKVISVDSEQQKILDEMAENQNFSALEVEEVYHTDTTTYAYNERGDRAVLKGELRDICRCESNSGGVYPKHYESDGVTVLSGRITPSDRGMCQINEYWHGDKALSKGYDIETPYGNIKYANDLYSRQGYYPWRYSGNCHGNNN